MQSRVVTIVGSVDIATILKKLFDGFCITGFSCLEKGEYTWFQLVIGHRRFLPWYRPRPSGLRRRAHRTHQPPLLGSAISIEGSYQPASEDGLSAGFSASSCGYTCLGTAIKA
jgi:hypothetical protein